MRRLESIRSPSGINDLPDGRELLSRHLQIISSVPFWFLFKFNGMTADRRDADADSFTLQMRGDVAGVISGTPDEHQKQTACRCSIALFSREIPSSPLPEIPSSCSAHFIARSIKRNAESLEPPVGISRRLQNAGPPRM